MKRKIFGMMMMAALGLCMAACGSDDDGDSTDRLGEEYFAGNTFKSKDGTVHYYRNGTFLFEHNEAKPAAGMISYGYGGFAFGTWDAVGDLVTTTVKVENIGMAVARRNVPERMKVTIEDYGKVLIDESTGQWVSYNTVFGYVDVTNAGSEDNAVKGKWKTKFYPRELAISVMPEYYAELGDDGTATLTGMQGSGLEVRTKYTASRGKITFEKFLNGKQESFYYSCTKTGMTFYGTVTATEMFYWSKN